MPDLPARPDLDQLRHQAKDLLHAAQRGEPAALARIDAGSGPATLSAAQLAIAREYGFASWAKLKLEVERRDILDSRDLSRLSRMLAEHPGLATENLQHWADRACEDPLGYVTMMRFNHGRLGLPGDLPGTGAVAKALVDAGAPVNGRPGARETPLITAASYGDADVARVLIQAGADIDAVSAPNSGGAPSSTALGHAAVYGMTGVVDVLVAAGARIASLEMAAAAGDITGWPLHRRTLQAPGFGRWRWPPTTSGWRSSTSSSRLAPRSTSLTRNGADYLCTSPRRTDGPPASGDCSPTAPTPACVIPWTTAPRWNGASSRATATPDAPPITRPRPSCGQ